ncbi:sushi, von Willebrand factor type A, EGF and pentraxin domain-containing protein 1-like isoform X2 [Littorina saxatilis]|uniref:sushi, von Willebrand factor type A, EGF and pentraxin domain-containing protein 1-like isoform X2 n=1 Tax=Littorina saxatilis TaxID=31220 RepID=UPI0038B4595D
MISKLRMLKAFRLLVATAVFAGGVECSSLLVDSEHVACTSLDDPLLKDTCQLTGKFGSDFRCYVAPGVRCGGRVHVGRGSVCLGNNEETGRQEAYKCLSGLWTTYSQRDILPGGHHLVKKSWRRFTCRNGWSRRCEDTPSPPPNKPPAFTYCPTVPLQVAERGTLQKTVSWAPPNATDPDEGPPAISVVSGGPQSGDLFNEGNTAVMYKARDSHGATDYCIVTVQVKVVYCPRADYVQDGRQSCNGVRHNVYGSECSHTCNTGYELQGSPSVTCQDSGTWNPSTFPTCQPVSCGVPSNVSGGQLVCPGRHVFPQLCVISCQAGYSIQGAPFVTCRADRSWSQALPCQDGQPPSFTNGCPANQKLYSGPLETPVTVTWVDPVVNDNSGQSVTLSSSLAKGAALGPGFHVIRVTATDNDSNSAACNFVITVQARTCSSILSPPNSHVTCTKGYVEGSECTVTCNPGYRPQGNATLQCLNTELWNATTPSCDIKTCQAPSPVPNGQWTCFGGYNFQSVCILNCDPGFKVQGTPNAQCLANATWSTDSRSCLDAVAPSFTDTPCHDNVEVYASRKGQSTLATFNDPAVTDNSAGPVTLISDVISGSSFPVGVTRVTYVASDDSSNSANCSFTVTVMTLTCSSPDLELANRTRTLMTYNCSNGYVHGASCTLDCSHGYPLIGSTNITCERDDSTYPPTMEWEWPNPQLGKPACRENNCSALAPPRNGALACYLADFGKYCLMSCEASWDVPAQTDGRFLCTNSNAYWVPGVAPDCIVRVRPGRVRLLSDMFYYTGSCQANLDGLRDSFISRLSNSTWKDACVNVPSCAPQNVEVTCGSNSDKKKKRSVDEMLNGLTQATSAILRAKRQATSHYILITFEIAIDYEEGTKSPQQAYQDYSSLSQTIYSKLQTDADGGLFNIANLTTDRSGIGYPTTTADCPPSRFFQATVTTTSFSCEVCTAGHTSPNGFAPCQPCPPGHYQPSERASVCLACPAGTWTSTGIAPSLDHCIESDVRLSNNSLSGHVNTSWSTLGLQAWLFLMPNTSVAMSLTVTDHTGLSASFSAVLYTDGFDMTLTLPGASPTLTTLKIDAEKWTSLLWNLEPGNSAADVVVYHQDVAFNTFNVDVLASSVVNVNIESGDTYAMVSGLKGDIPALTQGQITSSLTSCKGDKSSNVLKWRPSPSAIFLPSVCDAVNECLSSPCGSNGVCENRVDDFSCQCQDGWSGSTCHLPPDSCYQHQCQNGATCVPGSGDYSCSCDAAHSGERCEIVKEHGGWGPWLVWSECSTSCEGRRTRQRECNNPPPRHGGDNCTGSDTETSACGATTCPVHGGWSLWVMWPACNALCGGGERTRQRRCDNPLPQYNGTACEGLTEEKEACNTDDCPVHGAWGGWTPYSPCTVTCAGGIQSRDRSCDNPAAALGGRPCVGEYNETRICNNVPCPVCSPLTRPRGGLLTCDQVTSPKYLKTCNLTCLSGYVSSSGFPVFTCGEDSGYVWNHQRNHTSTTPSLPSCSKPSTLQRIVIKQYVVMDTQCDTSSSAHVEQLVHNNMQTSLPCLLQNKCTTKITSQCFRSRRRRRSAEPLELAFEILFDFGSSQLINTNDTAALASYEQLLTVAENSFVIATENDTHTLYTVTVNGNVISPANASYDIIVQCPAGSTAVDVFCVECPEGSAEQSGQCVLCPVGQYQDQAGSTTCNTCPDGLGYDVAGASDVTQCIYPTPTASSGSGTPTEDSSDTGMIVGVTCAVAVLLLAVSVGFVVYKLKAARPSQNGLFRRPTSALSWNRVSPMPDDDRATPPPPYDRHDAGTPSALNSYLIHDNCPLNTTLPPVSTNM